MDRRPPRKEKETGALDRLLLLLLAPRLDQIKSRGSTWANQSRWSSDGLLPCARVRENHGCNLHLSAQRLGGMPESSDTPPHSYVAHALEWTGNQGCCHPGTTPAE